MDNKKIKTVSMVIALAVLVFSGAYLYRAYQKFRALPLESHIQRQMEKATGMKTKMEGASVRVLGGLELVVTNASMGNPGEGFFLRAERASIRFSLWHILLGRVKLARIKILRPYIEINRKASPGKGGGKFSLPPIIFENVTGRVFYNGTAISLGGDISGKAEIASDGGLSLKGHVLCDTGIIVYNNRVMALAGLVEMDGRRFSTDRLRVSLGASAVDISGSLSTEPAMIFTGDIGIEGVKLGAGGTQGMPSLNLIQVQAGLNINNIDFYGIRFYRGSARVNLRDGALVLNNIEMYASDGSAKGSAVVEAAGVTGFDITASFENIDAEPLIKSLSGTESWIRGSLSVNGRLWGNASSLNGDFSFTALKGKIMKLSLLSKIFGVLNIYRLAKSGGADLTRGGMTFNSISSTVSIRNSVAKFENLRFNSNSLQIAASGLYNLASRQIDADMGVEPLEAVDKAVGIIPLVGKIFTDGSGKFIVVGFKVQGNIDDPTVRLDPGSQMKYGPLFKKSPGSISIAP